MMNYWLIRPWQARLQKKNIRKHREDQRTFYNLLGEAEEYLDLKQKSGDQNFWKSSRISSNLERVFERYSDYSAQQGISKKRREILRLGK